MIHLSTRYSVNATAKLRRARADLEASYERGGAADDALMSAPEMTVDELAEARRNERAGSA